MGHLVAGFHVPMASPLGIIGAVRTSPIVGEKAWFGPRRFGWGLGPVSPEGWAVTAGFTALATAIRQWKGRPPWARLAMFAAFLLILFLKGSEPGGAGARADFDAARKAATTPAVTNP